MTPPEAVCPGHAAPASSCMCRAPLLWPPASFTGVRSGVMRSVGVPAPGYEGGQPDVHHRAAPPLHPPRHALDLGAHVSEYFTQHKNICCITTWPAPGYERGHHAAQLGLLDEQVLYVGPLPHDVLGAHSRADRHLQHPALIMALANFIVGSSQP